MRLAALFVSTWMSTATFALAQPTHDADPESQNKADRLEWFRDQGFGMFIHWSVDSQLGVVISHSLVGASEDYTSRFFNDLPKTFDPRKFHPEDWAALAKLAGVKYVVFTTKHHSGFCMFDTATTPFNILHTPFHRDTITAIFDAFRGQGIAAGIYFSPDDFWWLWKNGKTIQRGVPEVQPAQNPGLLKHDQTQIQELLTKYGNIDLIFFDGEARGLSDLAWKINPNIIVTRGAIQTPEQYVPGIPLEGPWEANLTMGTAWQYQPQNEIYKSGGQVISLLIETRAKGGNLLMNVGPKPDGDLPIEQEERLREVALWMFVNQEAIYAVRPWVITNEHEIWFTRKKDADTLYAIVKEKDYWRRGEWKNIILHSVRATDKTEVTLLGQNDKVYEYQPNVIPKTTFRQGPDGLHIRAFRSQRLQDNSKWPNPAVLKLTNVKPAFAPPQIFTERFDPNLSTLNGELRALGDSPSLEVGFEYRDITGLDTNERSGAWTATSIQRLTGPAKFSAKISGWESGHVYEFRALVKHPLLTMYGAEIKATAR
jgi:alpha-L-fucosidase